MGTFKVVAKLSKITFEQLHVTGKLKVDKNAEGKTVMQKIDLDIVFSGVDRPERLDAIVAKTIRDGFILNSIKSEIEYTLRTDGTHP